MTSSGEPGFRWDDLRLFLAAFREGSLTQAARALGLNQSTTSRRLSALEEALGTRLFDRTPEGLVPTELAEQLLGPAERAEQASHEVLRTVAGASGEVRGEVRVAIAVGMAYVLAPHLPALRRRHPALHVSFVVATTLADLTRHEADVAVRYVRPERGDLVSRRVFHGAYGLYGAPSFVRALGPGPHALNAIDFVGWDAAQTHFGEARWEKEAGLRCVARADELITRLELAKAGVGAIELATELGDRLPGLVRVEDAPEIPLTAEVWLVTHRALRDAPRIRAVWSFVEHALSELPDAADATS